MGGEDMLRDEGRSCGGWKRIEALSFSSARQDAKWLGILHASVCDLFFPLSSTTLTADDSTIACLHSMYTTSFAYSGTDLMILLR